MQNKIEFEYGLQKQFNHTRLATKRMKSCFFSELLKGLLFSLGAFVSKTETTNNINTVN